MKREANMLKDFTKEAFDVIIQAGQSNAEGCGLGPVDVPYQTTDKIWAMEQNGTIGIAAEQVCGNDVRSNFALSFADEYVKAGLLKAGRKVLILRTAVGGTGFLDNRWKPQDDLFIQMTDMIRTALALNVDNRLICLIWHQGETDAVYNASYDVHYENLFTLVKLTRETFRAPELPFIAADFVHQWRDDNAGICAPVLDAIRAVCRDCGNAAFVETDGLLSNRQQSEQDGRTVIDDTIHFSRRALYTLGKRYFDAYRAASEQ